MPDNKHAADILLGMRMGLDLYINLRPIKLLNQKLTPLKERGLSDIDFVVFRENTEGMYVFMGGNFSARAIRNSMSRTELKYSSSLRWSFGPQCNSVTR